MINILEKINEKRQDRGWSEYMLAEKSELPQSTISSWYRKNMLPSLASLEKICNAFDMSMSQFLADDEPFPLDKEQKQLIEVWETLSKKQKFALLELIKVI